MQLINKKVIDLSCYLNGNKYQYIIEKRKSEFSNITNVEQQLINYLFISKTLSNLDLSFSGICIRYFFTPLSNL